MKFIVFACLFVVAVARPDSPPRSYYSAPDSYSAESVEIIRDDRVHPSGGSYAFDVETADGIKRSESGSALKDVEGNPTGQQGSVYFTFPNGEKFELSFVADENGYQPKSPFIHPIPQFVQDQIDFAASQKSSKPSSYQPPRRTYGYDK